MLLVLGANPAWQRLFRCRRLEPGEVVRGERTGMVPAGKGMNCARVLHRLGEDVRLVGGDDPRGTFSAAVQAEGIGVHAFALAGEVRVATTVHEADSGRTTELVEAGPACAPSGAVRLASTLSELEGQVRGCVALGTLPDGLEASAVLQALWDLPGTLIVDSVPLVKGLQTDRAGLWIKLNEEEWQGFGIPGEPVEAVLAGFARRFPRAGLVATLGARGCMARLPDGNWVRRRLPAALCVRAVHPIGAGDTFAAALLQGLAGGQEPSDALGWAVALSWASCLDPRPAWPDPVTAREVLREVEAWA
jgi:tagatose 6-phosphate kinase